ncbi:unnamed protein product [Dracunculus medinensis]|uniref:Uncharacterized protein n=1 Tax=Dracunculus medinensis TaxID=318479 RepID=A0A3P7PTL0_DRAME|nr:unnamed protein product [Dracunculus medinensis]
MKKGDVKGNFLKKRKEISKNEIISSSDDDNLSVDDAIEEKSDSDFEDTQELAYHKAKQFIAELEAELGSERNEEDEDVLAARLKKDALLNIATSQRYIAEKVQLSESSVHYRPHSDILCPSILNHFDFHIYWMFFLEVPDFLSLRLLYRMMNGLLLVVQRMPLLLNVNDLEEGRKIDVLKYDKKNRNTHNGQIFALAISAGDRYLATGGADMIIRVWNFLNFQHVKNLLGHKNFITGLVFRKGTQQLFSCSKDKSVKAWDLDQMGYVDTMFGHVDVISDIDALSRERIITCGSQDRSVRLWKIAEETHLVFNGITSCISIDCVAFLNDEHFVSGSADGSLCIWSTSKKKPVCVQKHAHGFSSITEPNWIVSVAATSYTDLVASGSCDNFVRFWKISIDYRSISNLFSFYLVGFVNCLRFSQNGDELVCAVGQEHKSGRWWKISEAKNSIVLISLKHLDN